MTGEKTISVIIAMYNAETYLPQCLDSLRDCPSDMAEFLLVNDGSTDGTEQICIRYTEMDSRFRLIGKENTGVSDSRNMGMDAANGKYLLFLDADDYIETAQWPPLLELARLERYDMAAFGYYSLFPSGRRQEERFPFLDKDSADPMDARRALLATPMLNTCWGKLLRREVIERGGVRFRTALKTCEDAIFIIDFVQAARTFLLSNRCVLNYRIHAGSVMRRMRMESKLRDFQQLYDRRNVFFSVCPEESLREAMYRQYFSVLTNLFLEYASQNKTGACKTAYAQVLRDRMVSDILQGVNAHTLTPFFKKYEYLWMRRRWAALLAFYFQVKSSRKRE